MKQVFLLISLIFSVIIQAQNYKISGKVTNETGEALPFANVYAADSINIGTQTNLEGFFSFELPNGTYTLKAAYVGYQSSKIRGFKVENADILGLEIILKEEALLLDELILIAEENEPPATEEVYEQATSAQEEKITGKSKSKEIPSRPVSASATATSAGVYNQNGKNTTPKTNVNESYAHIEENAFKKVTDNPLSTFSIDVDRAAYSNMRRYINEGQKPPVDAIRIEEFINYFEYNYPKPEGKNPVGISHELSNCPWNKNNLLLRVAMAAQKIETDNLPSSNLVFLLDVSGSMNSSNKLPLVKQSLIMLLDNLREQDRVAIVVYAGSAGLVLPSTSAKDKEKIISAINNLHAGGSTAGGAGINLAYAVAKENFIKNGNNRVILATDGDFNVGVNSESDLDRLIEEKRKDGIFLTCLGFGTGNFKDSKMEILANKGNGNYGYIDEIKEAQKLLVKEFGSTIHTVAKDVKTQIEFNPKKVEAYRLIGYENRLLNDEDFLDDTKDAGEIGSGHTVTILYEIVPVGVKSKYIKDTPKLKYSKEKTVNTAASLSEIATIKVRYKTPLGLESKEISQVIIATNNNYQSCSNDHKFIGAVTLFGLVLSNSQYIEKNNITNVLTLLQNLDLKDDEYKLEFKKLVQKAEEFK